MTRFLKSPAAHTASLMANVAPIISFPTASLVCSMEKRGTAHISRIEPVTLNEKILSKFHGLMICHKPHGTHLLDLLQQGAQAHGQRVGLLLQQVVACSRGSMGAYGLHVMWDVSPNPLSIVCWQPRGTPSRRTFLGARLLALEQCQRHARGEHALLRRHFVVSCWSCRLGRIVQKKVENKSDTGGETRPSAADPNQNDINFGLLILFVCCVVPLSTSIASCDPSAEFEHVVGSIDQVGHDMHIICRWPLVLVLAPIIPRPCENIFNQARMCTRMHARGPS